MSALLSYLREKRGQFAHNYDANCLAVARDIAGLLIADKRRPLIACLHKEEDRAEGRFHYPLMPKKYKGKVTYTRHYICCCDGMVYDPILEEPVRLEQYSMAVFGEEFPIEIYVAEEAIEEYVRP